MISGWFLLVPPSIGTPSNQDGKIDLGAVIFRDRAIDRHQLDPAIGQFYPVPIAIHLLKGQLF